MNAIRFECPHCREIITGDESQYGQQVKCPKCRETFLVPAKPTAEPATARLIAGTPDRPASASGIAGEEAEIFRLAPVARSFSGSILLAFLLFGLALGGWLYGRDFAWAPQAAAVTLGVGFLVLVGVWISVKASNYRLTTERLFIRRGWLAKHVDELELYRVKDVVVDQGIFQRLLGYGTITVLADDDTTPQLKLVSVARPTEIKEIIRTQYRAARQREGVRPTEFMRSP